MPEISPGLRCATGSAVVTPGADLQARCVIHAVGPVHPSAARWQKMIYAGKHARNHDPPLGVPQEFRSYDADEVPALLASAYRSAMAAATKRKLRAVAFPPIGVGADGCKPAAASEIALEHCLKRKTLGGLEVLEFVISSPEVLKAFQREADKKVWYGVLAK